MKIDELIQELEAARSDIGKNIDVRVSVEDSMLMENTSMDVVQITYQNASNVIYLECAEE